MTNNQLTLYVVLGAALIVGLTGFYFAVKLSPGETRIGLDKNCPESSWLMNTYKKNDDPARFYNELMHMVNNDLNTQGALLSCKRDTERLVKASYDLLSEELKTPQTEVELRERVSKAGECASPQTQVLYKAINSKYR